MLTLKSVYGIASFMRYYVFVLKQFRFSKKYFNPSISVFIFVLVIAEYFFLMNSCCAVRTFCSAAENEGSEGALASLFA